MAWRSGAASSSRLRATRSSRPRRRRWRFRKPASASIQVSAARSARRGASGEALAKWLLLSGQTIGAEEALAIGMVDKVVPYEQLDATIREVIAAGPAKPFRGPKPVPDSHRSFANFFDRHDVDELLAGQATLAR